MVVADFQPTLFDDGPPRIDASFRSATRMQLDERSWVDVVPGWVRGADELFDSIVEIAGWKQRNRWMYDQRVDEPRLTSTWRTADGEPILPVICDMQRALSGRYGVTFDAGGLNLYRDGRDSVAWHGDRIPKELDEPVVAVVSLGHRRTFRLRPKGGGRSISLFPDRGDLVVTGGRCQREWEHAVPKTSSAGPRLSITFRHTTA